MVEILWGEHAEGIDNRWRRVRTHLGALMRGSGSFCLKSGIQSGEAIVQFPIPNVELELLSRLMSVHSDHWVMSGPCHCLSWSISATFSISSMAHAGHSSFIAAFASCSSIKIGQLVVSSHTVSLASSIPSADVQQKASSP